MKPHKLLRMNESIAVYGFALQVAEAKRAYRRELGSFGFRRVAALTVFNGWF